jgi:subfamily B ATP-binding cassette protein HlyB/CyaB
MVKDGDSGHAPLLMYLEPHGVAVEGPHLLHRFGTAKIGVVEMLRCAKELGLKARAVRTRRARLARSPLPAIAPMNDGRFLIPGKIGGDRVLV